ncbi:MAG: hypothetical protein JWN30_575 [Bacilli bacterium]|nr:hypothetical protein [Bacilli bacterium]
MKDQAVLASFKDPDTARNCEAALNSLGVSEVQIDRVDAYPGDTADRLTNFISEGLPSLAAATLGTTFESKDASILSAAHPDASGFAARTGDLTDTTGYDILLTAVCDPALTEQVVATIKSHGGRT